MRTDEYFSTILKKAKTLIEDSGLPIDTNVLTAPPKVRLSRKPKLFHYEGRDEPITDPKLKFKVDCYMFS